MSPLIAILALACACSLGHPVLFRQVRPGFRGKSFTLIKLRTMRDAIDPYGRLLADSERLTTFGAILRRASLDEIPQLWNVLRGDLSLVGPRPLLPEYLPLYTPTQTRRHEVKPGITGWAQVNGRNAIGWDERFALDVWYVDNWSPWLDIKILAKTAGKVVRREGVSAHGFATMPHFRGGGGQAGAPPVGQGAALAGSDPARFGTELAI